MHKFRILALLCLALAFTASCSDNKDEGGGGTGKWCVFLMDNWDDVKEKNCGEIGAKLINSLNNASLTEEMCHTNYGDNKYPAPAIEDEKPGDCDNTLTK